MNKSVVIVGASGHGKVVADIVLKNKDNIVGFLDDNTELEESFAGFPVLGTTDQYQKYSDACFVIAIGNAAVREKLVNELKNVSWYTAIHPTAVISELDANIGEGTVIMANAVVNAGARIGRHCIINTGAVVEHDNQIADYVHVSVGAKLAGTVTVGKSSWIGIGASVSNNLNICGSCMIGAGAVVVKNIKEPGIYVGVPVERKERMKKLSEKSMVGVCLQIKYFEKNVQLSVNRRVA